ncbi:hypothetical protein TTHERM_00037410 (macronuclear) [Tetrahymena thermophila SB210]|uniref:Kinase domain protein n=1 Tax=Tetrahymena thermophila (strain SB210) TaxID=312017 RepID=Q22M78_TETTS|nr:hypothetical protein TTHERM_00037410 [Tetrahymena thermophila SB210]EAR86364.2 hypothetical protein TTHERM_00037410 [Tetrahymena thermophila SB210]|eukprot:XP_977142.2 hypothetical protein TTHERM_00037410 [Tetrahymena thermophila SB210]
MMQQKICFDSQEDFLNSSLSNHTDLEIYLRQSFDLKRNFNAQSLFSALSKCIQLKNLAMQISNQAISVSDSSDLGSAIANCTNISTLILLIDGCRIGYESMRGFASGLSKCFNLQTLGIDLQNNDFGVEGYLDLTSALSKLSNLTELGLVLNGIDDKGFISLVSGLVNCTNLKALALEIGRNAIQSEGASTLGSVLPKLTKLQILQIVIGNYHYIEYNGYSNLLDSLSQCNQLNNLTLGIKYKRVVENEDQRKKILMKFMKIKKLVNLQFH